MLDLVREGYQLFVTMLLVPFGATEGAAQSQPPQTSALVLANDPPALVQMMTDDGYKARLDVDSDGDPIIKGRVSGVNYSVLFYGCASTQGCYELQFEAGFDLKDGLSWEQTNAWNRSERYGKVYLDDEMDPYLEMNVTMEGGISADNFMSVIQTWQDALDGFSSHIDW